MTAPTNAVAAARMGEGLAAGFDDVELGRAELDQLAPGGVFVVIDHHASEGRGTDPVQSTPRIGSGVVAEEVAAAGSWLAWQSALLENPADNRRANVFTEPFRGRTDRFRMVSGKPAAGAGRPK